MTEPERVENGQRRLGHRLAAYRRAAGLTQEALASKTGYSRSTVANVETGRQKAPRSFWRSCDDALGPDAGLLRLYDKTDLPHPTDTSTAGHNLVQTLTIKPPEVTTQLIETLREVNDRRRLTVRSNVDEAKMAYLEAATLDAITANERQAPAVLAPRVRHLRHRVNDLLQGHQHPGQRQRLYTVALYQSGLLGALALELGRQQSARAYGLEAYELATYLENTELQAWTRATQSLIEYYDGNYHDALAYARDGQYLDPGGHHSVRLALNGEARALAKLGDHEGVEDAVTRGFEYLHQLPMAPHVGASLSTRGYHRARAYANAATAYLHVGQTRQVRAYAEPALAVFDSAGLRRPQALTRLDLATALLATEDARMSELGHACTLAREALELTREQRREAIAQRAVDFLRSASPWSNEQAVRYITVLVAEYCTGRPALEA